MLYNFENYFLAKQTDFLLKQANFLSKQANNVVNNSNSNNKTMSRKFRIDINFKIRDKLVYYIVDN